MMEHIVCPGCDGECSVESGILCGGAGCTCDGFSGGCTSDSPCLDCDGVGSVDADNLITELLELREEKATLARYKRAATQGEMLAQAVELDRARPILLAHCQAFNRLMMPLRKAGK